MPGSIIFKPLEVNLTHDTTLYGKPDPYCVVSLGDQRIQTQVGEKTEVPQGEGYFALQVTDESTCLVELKDHDNLSLGQKIGSCHVSLDEIESKGCLKKWYEIYDEKDHATGKILLEAIYTEENESLTDIPSSSEGSDEETLELESKGTREGQDGELVDGGLSPMEKKVLGNKKKGVRRSLEQGKKEDEREECKVDERGVQSETKIGGVRGYGNGMNGKREGVGKENLGESELKGKKVEAIGVKWDV